MFDNITTNPNKTVSRMTYHQRCDINTAGTTENISYAIYLSMILVICVFGNILVIFAVIKSQLKKKITFRFVVSLAISDILLGLVLIPFKISEKLFNGAFCYDIYACYLFIMSDAVGNIASILSLMLIAIDRFVAIKFPFQYEEILSSRRAKISIVIIWLFALAWSIMGTFQWKTDNKNRSIHSVNVGNTCQNSNYYFYASSVFGIYVPALIFMTTAYMIILKIAWMQIRAIAATESTLIHQLNINSYDGQQRINGRRKSRYGTFMKEIKATKAVATVYLAFVICWLPSCVVNVIILIDDTIFPKLYRKNKTVFLFIFYTFIHILPLTNTMLNPLIYAYSNRQFRKAFKAVFYKLIRKHTNYQEPLSSYTMDASLQNSPALTHRLMSSLRSLSSSPRLSPRNSKRRSPLASQMTHLSPTNSLISSPGESPRVSKCHNFTEENNFPLNCSNSKI